MQFNKYKKRLSYDNQYVYCDNHIIAMINLETKTLHPNMHPENPFCWNPISMKHKRYAAEQLGLAYVKPAFRRVDQYGRPMEELNTIDGGK